MTENSEDVFVSAVPYLRSVVSPYEDGSPKLKNKVSMSLNDFIKKLTDKYINVKLTKSNLAAKIKVVERSESGRIKRLMIDTEIVNGRDLRTIFNLNSTNFKINVHMKTEIVEIETIGNGHGVGMSQWGAQGMAERGSTYDEILKHYYTGVEIDKMD